MFKFLRKKLEPEYIRYVRNKTIDVPFGNISVFLNKASDLILEYPDQVSRSKYGISKITRFKIKDVYMGDNYVDYDLINEIYYRCISIERQLSKKIKNKYPPNVLNVYHNYHAFIQRILNTLEEDLDKF